MNFKHSSNLQESIDGMKKIFSISWSQNLGRIAVAHVDEKRTVRISLFDEKGERKESFPTRAANKYNKSYVVRDIAFSPDSTKLAVSQSDNIIFVYNIGLNWGDKKTICNKFEQNSQVTTMIWHVNKPNELYFGIAEGKVKAGLLKSNSAQILYSTDSYVVSMCSSPDGKFIISGQSDFTVHKYNLDNGNCVKLFLSVTIPYCLSCGVNNSIFLAGNDKKVYIYSETGEKSQTFDYNYDDKLKDYTVSKSSTSSDYIVIGNFNNFCVYYYNSKKNIWEEVCNKYIENYYTVTALSWKPDSLSIVTGSLCGSIDIFESCLKKSILADKFEITYLSMTQILIKNLATGKRISLKANKEIVKVNIQKENYIIINTDESLLLADFSSQKWSEISWNHSGNERYDFSNPNVCVINQTGELAVVEYGDNEILGYCRSDYAHPNLTSARINYKNNNAPYLAKAFRPIKLFAYLIDPFTIYVQDLAIKGSINSNIILTITHDSNIEFLDLNKNGTKMLFRDSKRHLYLYLINENRKITLLNYCNFVQWVPDTEVLVVQDRKNLIVWYNLEDVDNYKIINIKGDIEEVRRNSTDIRTEVIVEEEGESKIYLLDENLISLSIAVDDNELIKAVSILESFNHSNTEFDVYWKAVAKISMHNRNLLIAQRCFAAYGAYTKVNYIKKILKDVQSFGLNHPLIEARILILNKDFIQAENILIENNLIGEAISIFNEVHKYEESLRIAEMYNHVSLTEISENYLKWLLDNELLNKAAEFKVKKGEYLEAIKLYIKGDFYVSASNLIIREKLIIERNTIELLINAMENLKCYEKAAILLEFAGEYERCISMYIKSNCYSKALEISRKIKKDISFEKDIEEMWGDYLTSQMHIEQSTNHFFEAGRLDKAIESLINLRKWDKAEQLCDKFDKEHFLEVDINIYLNQIGEHYLKEKNNEKAQILFQKSSNFTRLFEIYSKSKNWENLEALIEDSSIKSIQMLEIKNHLMYLGSSFEKEGKLKDAERLFIYAKDPDSAIAMYKKLKNYDEMIKLVKAYLPDYFNQTCSLIAKIYENEGNLKEAERFLIMSKDWKTAIEMYNRYNMIEDSIRIAEKYSESLEIQLNLLRDLFKSDTAKAQIYLARLGKYELCTRYLCKMKQYEDALKIAGNNCKDLLPFVYLRYAIEMKDAKNFLKAEELFIASKHPKDAVDMHISINDYNNALRVARNNSEHLIPDIYLQQGNYFVKQNELEKAEICFVKAKRADVIYKLYLNAGRADKANSFAEKYAPELLDKKLSNEELNSTTNTKHILYKCEQLELAGDYLQAINLYLTMTLTSNLKLVVLSKILDNTNKLNKDDQDKINEILARKYLSINEYKTAGDILGKMGNLKEAISWYVLGNELKEAQNIIDSIRDIKERNYLQNFFNQRINTSINILIIFIGIFIDENERFIEEQKYEECLIKLKDINTDQFDSCFVKISSIFFDNRQYLQLSNLILAVNPTFQPKTIQILRTLASELLAEENFEELQNLKNIFLNLLESNSDLIIKHKELEKLQLITHYQLQKNKIKKYMDDIPYLYYCLCLTVLSYGDIIKQDVAIYDAMTICNKLDSNEMAFILANRYLDLYDCIEAGTELEFDKELEITNIPQKDIYLSAENYISIEVREEISKWVREKTVDNSFEKILNLKKCKRCNSDNFETNLKCKNCGVESDQCIISGFPIEEGHKINFCKKCKKKSSEFVWKCWTKYFDYCPWCLSIYNSF